MNFCTQIFVWRSVLNYFGYIHRSELVGHMVILSLMFWETVSFHQVIYILTSNIQEFLFFQILSNTYFPIFKIKTIVRYNLIPLRMFRLKKIRRNKYWWGYGEKGNLVHCKWIYKVVQKLRKTVWRFLKKLNIEFPLAPVFPLLGICPKKGRH